MAEHKTQVADWKIKTVEELKTLLSENKTLLIASIKDLPGSQFQEISKKLRGTAVVKVPKKNLIFRAIDSLEREDLKQIKEGFQNSVALLFSNLDAFDLAADLLKNKSPAKAKPGQEAPEDIEADDTFGTTDATTCTCALHMHTLRRRGQMLPCSCCSSAHRTSSPFSGGSRRRWMRMATAT